MKAIMILFFLFGSLAGGQEKSINLLETKISFEGEGVTVAEVFQYLSQRLKTPPNIVFKEDAGEHEIAALKVKEVSLGNLFRVVESIADVQIEIIEDHNAEGPQDDPFAAARNLRILTNSGIVVVASTRTVQKQKVKMLAQSMPVVKKKEEPSLTEVIPVGELKFPVEALVDVIQTTWEEMRGEKGSPGKLAYHDPLKLLIVTGSKNEVELAQKIAGALLPEYQKRLNEVKVQVVKPVNRVGYSAGVVIPEISNDKELDRKLAPRIRAVPNYRSPKGVPLPVPSEEHTDDLFGG